MIFRSRFILTHPDMDHLDGFDELMNTYGILNFWDSGVRKDKGDFRQCPNYKEADWDRYVRVRDREESVKSRSEKYHPGWRRCSIRLIMAA